MKNKFRNVLLATASIMFSAACFGSLATFAANAAGETSEYLFTMNQGASVRKNKDTAGIRFSYTVTDEQYDAFQDENKYTDVTYGMIISTTDIVSIGELYEQKAGVFTNSAYTFDVEAWKANRELKLLVNITGDALVKELDDEGVWTNNYLFNAALTNIAEENYTKAYVGMGYVKATPAGGEETYYFAENVENTRTITYVAEKAQEANETDPDGIIANYVTKGYAGLGLSGAGTEKTPYVVESADYETLKKATQNGTIYGAGKCMEFAEGVDYTNLATDFAGRNYNFVWATADTATEVELFNAPTKTSAAYYVGLDGKDKEVVNGSAQYYDEFEGRYGVVSLKSTHYYHNKTNDFTAAASNDGAGVAGWRYYFASASGYTRSSGGWDDETWDYMSIWLYIAGETGASATIMEQFGRNSAVVPCNTWYEFRYEQSNCITCFDDRAFNPGTTLYPPLFAIKGLDGYAVTEAFEQEKVFEVTNNPTVYIDSITFEVDPIKSLAVTKLDGTKAQITAEQSSSISETLDITYTVKSPVGTELTVADDLTFATGVAGTYKVTASSQYNGKTYTKTAEYTVEVLDMMAENEIEGFYSADSVAAAYGVYTNASNKIVGDKSLKNDTARWYESFEGHNGVISLESNEAYGGYGLYRIKSTVRTSSYYGYDLSGNSIAWTDEEQTWDYISIVMYVKGDEGEKVTIGDRYLYAAQRMEDIECNKWVELKLYREYLDYPGSHAFSRVNRQFDGTNNNQAAALFAVSDGNSKTADNYTVYLDTITYEKGEIVEAAVSGTLETGAEITVTPTISGYEGQTIDWIYNVELVSSSTKECTVTKDGQTGKFSATTAGDYLITVRAELADGTVLYGSKIVTITEATTA